MKQLLNKKLENEAKGEEKEKGEQLRKYVKQHLKTSTEETAIREAVLSAVEEARKRNSKGLRISRYSLKPLFEA